MTCESKLTKPYGGTFKLPANVVRVYIYRDMWKGKVEFINIGKTFILYQGYYKDMWQGHVARAELVGCCVIRCIKFIYLE